MHHSGIVGGEGSRKHTGIGEPAGGRRHRIGSEEILGIDIHRINHFDVLHTVEHSFCTVDTALKVARLILCKHFAPPFERSAIVGEQVAGLIGFKPRKGNFGQTEGGLAVALLQGAVSRQRLVIAAAVPE